MKRNRIFLLILIVLLVSCSSVVKNISNNEPENDIQLTTFKALMSSKTVYDNSFKILGELNRKGKLPIEVKNKAIQAGNNYVAAHNLAVKLLLDEQNPDMTPVYTALNTFLQIVSPYIK